MRLNRLFIFFLPLALLCGCGGGGGGGSVSTPRTLVSLSVAPASPKLAPNTTQQLSATGTFSDNTTQDLSSSVSWTSSSGSVAAIDATGRVTAQRTGTTTITAASGTVSGATVLTVTSATLVSIAVKPATFTLAPGTAQQFSATGTYSDNSTQDISASVTWGSSVPSVAAVSNLAGSNGRASSLAAGSTTITAVSGAVSASASLTVTGAGSAQINVMPITVNGSLCSSATSGGYFNKPCVSVTVCTPGTSNCQVINDILLDTGSYGLRIFKQALTSVPLPQVAAGSGSLTECVQYADGSSDWGPVQIAKVSLGNEPAVQVPIQVIDSTFGTRSRGCLQSDATPFDAGFTGILGVGLFAADCGESCASSSNNGNYYSCTGSVCRGAAVPLANQVTNPVALLSQDNNGVLVQLQSVPAGGASSLNGSLILGIGTRANNSPAGALAFPANSAAEFTTTFNGVSSGSSFIDSGSNGLFFPAPAALLPVCGGSNTGFYCPATTLSLSATDTGAFGSPTGSVLFEIGNFSSLINTGNNVFFEAGGSGVGGFDWGLPFFFGRNVYVGLDGTSSALGAGPYWAY